MYYHASKFLFISIFFFVKLTLFRIHFNLLEWHILHLLIEPTLTFNVFYPKVFLGLPFDGQGPDNQAYIKLYIKSTAKVKKMVYDYTVLSLIAEIGGYTGLLLGVSVLNLTSVVNILSNKFLHKI